MAKETAEAPEAKTSEATSITAKKLGYICLGLLVLLMIFKNAFGSGSGEKQDTTTPDAEIAQTKGMGVLREYNIVDRNLSEQVLGENLDDAFEESLKENPAKNKELVLRVVVPPGINEEDLKATTTHIINDETSKDNDLDEITVFVYDREEDVDGAYTVAKVTWAPGGELGNVTKEIAKNNDRGNYEIKWNIKERIRTGAVFSSDEEREIYYRYSETLSRIHSEEGLDPLPKVGEKDAPTPKADKAKKMVAEAFNITTDELIKIISRVEDSKPTEEELEAFYLFDDELEKAEEEATERGGSISREDEEAIRDRVAESLGIPPRRLDAIWIRVFTWQQEE